MTIFEMAQRYYPRLWDKKRLEALVEAGRITRAEFDQLVKGDEDGAE